MVSQLRHPPTRWWVVFFLAAGTMPARAATKWPVARGPSHEPLPYRYDRARVKKLPRAFLEDPPACTLYTATTFLIEADGTVETIFHEIIRFNRRGGIEKLGEYQYVTFNPAYQKLTLNEARVLKAGGQTESVEPRHVQLRDQNTDYASYNHEKRLIISFPHLEVGDAVEVKVTVRGKNPEHDGYFFNRYTFAEDQNPVARDELLVRLPKTQTLKYAAQGGKLPPRTWEEGKFRFYHWRLTNLRQVPSYDDLPPREELRRHVVLSTFPSWDAVGRWIQKLRKGSWECGPDLRRVVARVTKNLTSDEAKARALATWVRRNVRYVHLSGTTLHEYKPLKANAVFTNRYGDCKDQVQLLAVMMRQAGLRASLVSLGVRDDGQIAREVPSPWASHMILLVTIGGKRHWVDTTVPQGSWDFLSLSCMDRLAYVVDDQGCRLLRTPGPTADQTRYEQTTTVAVAADGSTRNRRRVVFHGAAAVIQRDAWSDLPAVERRLLLAAELQNFNTRARLRRLEVSDRDLRDLDRPLTTALEFDIPAHFGGRKELEGVIGDPKVYDKLMRHTLEYDRQVALDLGRPFISTHRFQIQLPVALQFDGLPRDRLVESKWGTFRRTVRADAKDPRRAVLVFHTRMDKTRIEVADIPRFREFQEEVYRAYRPWFDLKPTQDLADASYLEALQYLAPDDVASAAVLAQLYCRHDRRPDARRVLDWARFLHPRAARLWELTVRAAADPAEEETTYQEMVRRFPRELKYVLALGATRVKRGKYPEAKQVLEGLTRKAPAALKGAAFFQLARAEFRQGRSVQALRRWEAAAQADPDSVSSAAALLFKGQIYEQLKRPREAGRAYRQALRADSEAEEALLALIRLELAAGRRAGALDFLRRYTVLVRDDLRGLVRAADYHLRLGRTEDAADLAQRALDIRFDAQAQRVLGLVHARRGRPDLAVPALARAEKTPAVRETLIRGNLALGRLLDAVRQAKEARPSAKATPGLSQACTLVEQLSERRKALVKRARLSKNKAASWGKAVDAVVCAEYARDQGRPAKEVAKLLARALGSGVDLGPAYSLRGLLALERGRLSKALEDARKALALDRQDARAYYVRGRVRYERKAAGALADLKRAAELTRRKDAVVLHALAAALHRARRFQDALTAQREAVKLRPHDSELREQLREFEKQAK
jgi:tetratricopeptide (TPR) repeat protein/transglutaminase-like putative cysteine protease